MVCWASDIRNVGKLLFCKDAAGALIPSARAVLGRAGTFRGTGAGEFFPLPPLVLLPMSLQLVLRSVAVSRQT